MKKEIDTNRFIGDSLEVYGDIVTMIHNDKDKKPKFIRVIQAKNYHRKLVRIIKKIRNSNKPLTKENLAEYFSYLFSSFPPYGSYKNMTAVNIIENTGTIMAVFKLDIFVKAKFVIRENDEKFNLIISVKNPEIDETKNYDLSINELFVENKDIKQVVNDINVVMLSNITDFILSSISLSTNGNEV